MLFNSLEFILFLPIVFLLYWFVFNRSLKLQNLFIVVVSYIFYGWWDWRFLILIGFTSFCSFLSGLLIEKYDDQPLKRKLVNTINIVINLFILAIFKYYNFFVGSFSEAFGVDGDSLLLNVILPVGVSFYTFQALSYSIDVYRRTLKPTHNVINLFAYVSFFPQLVAGPIERATNLLPQFERERKFDYSKAIDGCRQMLWGFFKKIIIADMCAVGVNNIFDSYTQVGGGLLIVGALLFTFQIYGDFSGYSDIAIGCSKLFGIDLMRNFNIPYFSRDVAEFWRRWHISLTTWFRDYIYIPLGGSRVSKWLSIRNTFIIFLVSGFWHGANWTFVAWGAYHALLFVPLLLMNKNRKFKDTAAPNSILPSLREVGQIFVTFILVAIGWIIFRAPSIEVAMDYIVRIVTDPFVGDFSVESFVPLTNLRVLAYAIPLLIFMEWVTRQRGHGLDFAPTWITRYGALRWIIYYALAFFMLYNLGEVNTFIYFQF